MKKKASLLALKDLMDSVVKPSLLASLKVSKEEPKKESVKEALAMPEVEDAEEDDSCPECEGEGCKECMGEAAPKSLGISITRLASLEKQKAPTSKKKGKK
jgi:hypothetical protein